MSTVTDPYQRRRIAVEVGGRKPQSAGSVPKDPKKQTGLSPRQYQIEIRFSRARDFLTQSDQTISQISDRLGFYSVYYFSRFFKERTGMPPSVYRKQG